MRSSRKSNGSESLPAGGVGVKSVSAPPTLLSGGPDPATWRGLLQVSSRAALSFPATMVASLFVLIFARGRIAIADPDIWWHLRNAKILLGTHRFLRYDVYSFTAPGHPWINTEWLAELAYYLAWRWDGLVGIEILMLALFSLIVCAVLYLSYRESGNFNASFVASCFAMLLASVSFAPRMILLGYLCLVALLIILQRFRRDGLAPLWFVPFLFCVWANTHGSWFLGLIVYSIIVASGLVRGTWGNVKAESWSPSEFRKLLFTGLASLAAVFVNPYGTRLVLYPLDLAFRQKLNVASIAEWRSVDFHNTSGRLVLALLLCLLLGALLRASRWTLTEVALLVFGLYCGLTYVRFLVLLGILAAPVLAKMLNFLPPYKAAVDKPMLNALLILAALGGMIWYRPTSTELGSSLGREYPTHALPYLAAHPLDGPLLNYFAWGGYLGWNDENLKVFVDSRVDIFEYSGVLSDYLDLLALNRPQQILDKYKIRYVLFTPSERLTYVLEHDAKWKVLYQDEISVLLQRVDGPASVVTAPPPESR
jgi:hypothetical protein